MRRATSPGFFFSPTNGNALAVYDPSLQSLNNAVSQQQAGVIRLTDSQMDAINAQAEVVQARANELMAQGSTQAGVTQTSPPVSEPAMADAISKLMNLTAKAQTQANVEAARQAYFDYLTASPEGKTAAYDSAVKQLRESINAALEIKGLDAEARETLDELLGEIANNNGSVVKLNEFIGGAYKDIPANGGQNHHMPADLVSPYTTGKGPVINMEIEDHLQTASWGNSKEAKAYRLKQKDLIEQGKFFEAQQLDIDDVMDLFGNKYDNAIQQMKAYTQIILENGKSRGGV